MRHSAKPAAAEDLAIWEQFPNGAFVTAATDVVGEEFRLGTFKL